MDVCDCHQLRWQRHRLCSWPSCSGCSTLSLCHFITSCYISQTSCSRHNRGNTVCACRLGLRVACSPRHSEVDQIPSFYAVLYATLLDTPSPPIFSVDIPRYDIEFLSRVWIAKKNCLVTARFLFSDTQSTWDIRIFNDLETSFPTLNNWSTLFDFDCRTLECKIIRFSVQRREWMETTMTVGWKCSRSLNGWWQNISVFDSQARMKISMAMIEGWTRTTFLLVVFPVRGCVWNFSSPIMVYNQNTWREIIATRRRSCTALFSDFFSQLWKHAMSHCLYIPPDYFSRFGTNNCWFE